MTSVVFDMSKIQFWKQITTTQLQFLDNRPLFSICQRYNFESKSQRINPRKWIIMSCFRYVKDTILKANHNDGKAINENVRVVFDMSKIQFWKQITTTSISKRNGLALFSICQRYNFESKSQPRLLCGHSPLCCFRYVKDTILKANHNNRCVE